MELIYLASFCMTYSLRFLLILSHQIRRWRKFWKHIIDGINLTHHLQQEEKSGKRKIARCTILKLVDGGQAKPSKLGNLFLGEITSHSIFLESHSQQAPFCLFSQIKVFFAKKVSKSHFSANLPFMLLIYNTLQE